MTMTSAVAAPPTAASPAAPRGVLRWAGVAAVGAGVWLAWAGGAAAPLGALLAACGGAAWRRAVAAAAPARAAVPETGPGGRHGAEVMVSQVVPVWSRQMEVTRDAANEGIAQLLATFNDMSGALGLLTDNLSSFSVTARPGATDEAVRAQAPALELLTAASRRAFEQRDAAVAALASCREELLQLQHLAKEVREIARHSRLVAFNASIEANRAGSRTEAGAQAVAGELRTLAGRMASAGEAMQRGVVKVSGIVRVACRDGELHDTSPDELQLEIELRARDALSALLGSLGASLEGSAQVHQAGQALRDQIDNAFVNFQFGDRVSQMMSIVANDMSNFARWVAANPMATQSDAAEWLASLEASYTMEEQRSHHHGNVHVERSSGVEFF